MRLLLLSVILLGLVLFVLHWRVARDDVAASIFQKKPLLTKNEEEFFHRLRQALPEHHVFPQVAMGALMQVAKNQGRNTLRERARFAQKIVDYVVCDRQLRVLGLIELDDATHRADKDKARDALTRSAGYFTLRYQSRAKPSLDAIARDVQALSRNKN